MMDVLKRAREASGISQKHMASQVGVSYPTYERMESNIKNARLREIETVYLAVNDDGKKAIRESVSSFFAS